MSPLKYLTAGLRTLFGKRQSDSDLDQELRDYLDFSAAEKTKSGMSRTQAIREARMEMGSMESVKEEVRSSGWESTFASLWQDIRYASRMLRKSPGFTAVAVLTLALGIGANSAIFSVVNAVLLRPLAFRDSGRLCLVSEQWPFNAALGPSYQNYVDFRDQSKSFDAIAAVRNTTFTLTGKGDPERLVAQMDTASMFPMLGVNALEGHTFLPEEDRVSAPSVVLLSYGFWQREFGGARNALGKTIVLDNQSYAIVGIMPPGFQLLQPVDVMVPLTPWAHTLPDDRNWHPGIIAIGRLKSGVNMQQAQAEMSTIAARLDKQYPIYNTGMGAKVSSLHETLVQNIRPALLVLLGAVGLVLLIACSNIANLLLARATSRQREIAIRTALGAGRGRILRQLLTESVLLALLGAAIGLVLAWAAMTPLLSLAGHSIPNVGPIGLDVPVVVFTAGIALLAGILFGLAPAWQTAKLDLRPALNESSRGSTGGAGRLHVRNVLVVTEVALALLLLVSAGLLIRSFERLQNVEPGFQSTHLLIANVPLSPQAYPKSAQRMDFFDHLIEQARALPGVVSAGAATNLPVSGGGSIIHFNITGRAPKTPNDYILVGYRPVSPDYLQTLRVPLLQGRMLTEADTEREPFVVIVNQSMAKQYFPGESALGKRVQLGALPEKDVPTME
ncbi:MAG: ADOP family duplicated permease, partial [Candidatus Acidiferrales bacterium]